MSAFASPVPACACCGGHSVARLELPSPPPPTRLLRLLLPVPPDEPCPLLLVDDEDGVIVVLLPPPPVAAVAVVVDDVVAVVDCCCEGSACALSILQEKDLGFNFKSVCVSQCAQVSTQFNRSMSFPHFSMSV